MLEWIEIYLGIDPNVLFINGSYILTTLAYLVRDILWLRSIALVSEVAMIAYGFLSGNLTISSWNMVFLTINTIQVIRLLLERRPYALPAELEEIYSKVFAIMTPREFMYFWQSGTEKNAYNSYVCRDGAVQKELMMIISGEVSILKNGAQVARLGAGSFVAEMSFLTGDPASADVYADQEVLYNAWSQEQLRDMNQSNPNMLIKIQVILGKDLSHKLKKRA